MKRGILLFIVLAILNLNVSAQGADCSNAITIPLDGACNNYTLSSATGNSVHCSGQGYGGNSGRVTYFKFTTNSIPQCVSLDITASVSGTHIEAVLYSGCSGTTPTGGNAYQSLCMDDGDGIWATNLWYSNLNPNSTYYLRVRTESGFTGTLQICGKSETPTNNLCLGATGIDTLTTISQNNVCNTGSTEVAPATLCAGSLENTAWYTFTVLTSGVSSVVISHLNCDNANFVGNNDYGFQIGFFTGNCGSLTATNCQAQTGAAGGAVIASSTTLPAGTVVHVAIDGFAGSNCSYDIIAVNAVPLSVKMKSFDGWKGSDFNLLTWVTTTEINHNYFEVERSGDGTNFSAVGRVAGKGNSQKETKYSFKDSKPQPNNYYRLKQVDMQGNVTYSRVIRIIRSAEITLNVIFENPVHDFLKARFDVNESGMAMVRIVNVTGKSMHSETINLQNGANQYRTDLNKLSPGTYYLVITKDDLRKTIPFIKF